MTRPTASRATRVEEIMRGAAQAFGDRGFAATSMRQVAQATGASVGSIYHHFGSKEGLLEALMTGNFRRVRASLEERLADISDPQRAIEAFVENHVVFFSEHLDEMRVMSHELDTLGGAAGEELRALRNSYTERARGFLRQIRPDLSETEIGVATLCFFGMLNWTYRWFHSVRESVSPRDLAGQMAGLFLDGFGAGQPAEAPGRV